MGIEGLFVVYYFEYFFRLDYSVYSFLIYYINVYILEVRERLIYLIGC